MAFLTSGGSTVNTSQLVDGAVTNAKVATAANLARTKLANPVLLKVRKSANQTLGGTAIVTFDTEVTDTDNAFASNVYTSPRVQNVMVVFNCLMANAESSARSIQLDLRVNGTIVRSLGVGANGSNPSADGGTLIEYLTLALNDTVDIFGSSTSTGQSITGGTAGACWTILAV